jgi:hypothetical protein
VWGVEGGLTPASQPEREDTPVAHLMSPQPSVPDLPVFFNVDGVVGAVPAENRREDVLLVQFLLKIIGDSPEATSDPAAVAACKQVKPTGVIDPATVAAITASQQSAKKNNPNVVVDGRISPAKGGYSYGATWTVVRLNKSAQKRHKGNWPRIDKIPGCPDELKATVTRVLVGT